MADTTTTTTAQAPASESAQPQATGATKVTDMGQVDEKSLQSYVDAQVRKALKTREEHLETAKQSALKKAEQDAAIARGEFDAVRKQLDADLAAARNEAQGVRVAHELKVAALQAGINDPDDVRLLSSETLANLTDEKGAINREAVSKAIEALKTSKGYLFKNATAQAPAFAGAASPGSAVPATPPADLTVEAWYRARQQQYTSAKTVKPPSSTDIVAAALNNRK